MGTKAMSRFWPLRGPAKLIRWNTPGSRRPPLDSGDRGLPGRPRRWSSWALGYAGVARAGRSRAL
eukprot:13529553-Alexandrium_andersonii.AAC.1